MKFSLVLATLGRTEDLTRFLASLGAQTYRNFELIVVDQNEDDRLVPVLAPYREDFRIVHLRSPKGLSRARNVGLQQLTGDVVAFPDDDCWYPSAELLAQVAQFFAAHPGRDGLTGRSDDGNGASDCRWAPCGTQVSDLNVWTTATSFTIFLKRGVVERVGGFDETLGIGSGTRWGAGEEIDFVLRALACGASVEYDPQLVVYHPYKTAERNDSFLARVETYARSAGRVIAKNRLPWWFLCYMNLRSTGGLLLSLVRGDFWKARFYYAAVSGRFKGYFDRQPGRCK
jgi:glycosyltransferase involved in cell wall biosynthesis